MKMAQFKKVGVFVIIFVEFGEEYNYASVKR